MSIMRCHCNRVVDLDSHLEDWDEDREECAACAEEELNKQAAAAAEETNESVY